MKTVKLIYLWIMYALAAPFILLFGIGYTIYYLYDMRGYGTTFEDVKELWMSAVEGLMIGHKINMTMINCDNPVITVTEGKELD